MTFSELDKESQDFLINQFNMQIDRKADEEDIDEYSYEYPTLEEYTEFFNNFDENYKMVDGYPVSTVEDEYHAKYSIDFDNGKVILNTFDSDYDE